MPRPRFSLLIAVLCCAVTCASLRAAAQTPPTADQLNTLVAPIALYPDALLADVLAASTYPVEVVVAARAVANGGKPTASQMAQWDDSVQALVDLPTVLTMMSNQLDWTTELGQAVSRSQSSVMAAVQRVRAEARKAGNLPSNDKQTVTTQGSTIVIQPANPQVIYVPQYNPVTIIEPAPPYAAAPAAYGLMTFGVGFAAGALTAYACDWGHGGGSITVNNNYNYNRNTNVNADKNTHVSANKYSSWKAPTNVGRIGPSATAGGGLGTRPAGGAGSYANRGVSDADRAGADEQGGAERAADGVGGADRFGSAERYGHEGGGGMFGGANGGGWAARAASDRGAESLGGGSLGRGFGRFRGGGGRRF